MQQIFYEILITYFPLANLPLSVPLNTLYEKRLSDQHSHSARYRCDKLQSPPFGAGKSPFQTALFITIFRALSRQSAFSHFYSSHPTSLLLSMCNRLHIKVHNILKQFSVQLRGQLFVNRVIPRFENFIWNLILVLLEHLLILRI